MNKSNLIVFKSSFGDTIQELKFHLVTKELVILLNILFWIQQTQH